MLTWTGRLPPPTLAAIFSIASCCSSGVQCLASSVVATWYWLQEGSIREQARAGQACDGTPGQPAGDAGIPAAYLSSNMEMRAQQGLCREATFLVRQACSSR
jgi:hypothetical protein